MSASNLPIHLLEEIFTRLPVKTLIILTSVCKTWLALISSQSFVKNHLSRYHLNPNNHSLLLHWLSRGTITILRPHQEIPAISEIGSGPDSVNSILVGSINGLVCMCRTIFIPTDVVIWNPATHRFKEFLLPTGQCSLSIGFGFNCVVNDYKVVSIHSFEMSFKFLMYSCNDNSWKELKPDFPIHTDFLCECVSVKGNPYWRGINKDLDKEILVTVNVETEVIRVFSGPTYVKNWATRTSIMALGEFAAQIVRSPGDEVHDMIHLYTLDEDSCVWTRMYTIPQSVEVQCYTNGKIFMRNLMRKLFMYDLVSKETKDLGFQERIYTHYNAINYTESLVAIQGMGSYREEAAEEERQE